MRMIVLSAVLALGVGLAGTAGVSAAPGGTGLGEAAQNATLLQDVQYYRRHYRRYHRRSYCRSVRVCHRSYYGRRCHWERVCR
jgi:hypothetical protein